MPWKLILVTPYLAGLQEHPQHPAVSTCRSFNQTHFLNILVATNCNTSTQNSLAKRIPNITCTVLCISSLLLCCFFFNYRGSFNIWRRPCCWCCSVTDRWSGRRRHEAPSDASADGIHNRTASLSRVQKKAPGWLDVGWPVVMGWFIFFGLKIFKGGQMTRGWKLIEKQNQTYLWFMNIHDV